MNKQKAIEKANKLGPEYKYVARDHDGWWYAFIREPYYEDGYWYPIDGIYKRLLLGDNSSESLTKIYDNE